MYLSSADSDGVCVILVIIDDFLETNLVEVNKYQGEEGSVIGIHQSRKSERVGCKKAHRSRIVFFVQIVNAR